MEFQIIIYKDGRDDIEAITKWYDLQGVGLGDNFTGRLDETMKRLQKNPTAFSYLFSDVRKVRLLQFPYIIFFKVIQKQVHIFGIIHAKRNPYLIQERFKALGL